MVLKKKRKKYKGEALKEPLGSYLCFYVFMFFRGFESLVAQGLRDLKPYKFTVKTLQIYG
jgi:hypothetical protein